MKRRRFSEAEKRAIVQAVEKAVSKGASRLSEIKKTGITDSSYYKWRKDLPPDLGVDGSSISLDTIPERQSSSKKKKRPVVHPQLNRLELALEIVKLINRILE